PVRGRDDQSDASANGRKLRGHLLLLSAAPHYIEQPGVGWCALTPTLSQGERGMDVPSPRPSPRGRGSYGPHPDPLPGGEGEGEDEPWPPGRDKRCRRVRCYTVPASGPATARAWAASRRAARKRGC